MVYLRTSLPRGLLGIGVGTNAELTGVFRTSGLMATTFVVCCGNGLDQIPREGETQRPGNCSTVCSNPSQMGG